MSAEKIQRAKRVRRTSEEKARIINDYQTAATPLARAEIMRREGVYSSSIYNWKKELRLSTNKKARLTDTTMMEVERLKREIEVLRKRAERAEDLVETLGKVHALLQNAADKSATDSQQSKKRS